MHAIETTVPLPLDQAEEAPCAPRSPSKAFGVLTEIDVAATLKAKLGIDRPPLKILGAGTLTLANQALELDPTSALVLPCNVVLQPGADGGTHIPAPSTPAGSCPTRPSPSSPTVPPHKLTAALDALRR